MKQGRKEGGKEGRKEKPHNKGRGQVERRTGRKERMEEISYVKGGQVERREGRNGKNKGGNPSSASPDPLTRSLSPPPIFFESTMRLLAVLPLLLLALVASFDGVSAEKGPEDEKARACRMKTSRQLKAILVELDLGTEEVANMDKLALRELCVEEDAIAKWEELHPEEKAKRRRRKQRERGGGPGSMNFDGLMPGGEWSGSELSFSPPPHPPPLPPSLPPLTYLPIFVGPPPAGIDAHTWAQLKQQV
jgi:hypothetical protein